MAKKPSGHLRALQDAYQSPEGTALFDAPAWCVQDNYLDRRNRRPLNPWTQEEYCENAPVLNAGRKPRLLLLLDAVLLLRLATRRLFALLFQLPPRFTRFEPVDAIVTLVPCSSSTHEYHTTADARSSLSYSASAYPRRYIPATAAMSDA